MTKPKGDVCAYEHQYRGRSALRQADFELNLYGVMGKDQLEFFVGMDWSSRDHQVCVVDMKEKVCAQHSFKHCGMGLTEMVDWIVGTTQSSPQKVGVAIETLRGSVVESLMGREFVVYSINTKQLDCYWDLMISPAYR